MNGRRSESTISIIDGPITSSTVYTSAEGSLDFATCSPTAVMGGRPSVSVVADRIAVLVHTSPTGTEVQHCVGVVNGEGQVQWGRHMQFAKGTTPSVSTNDMWMALAVYDNGEGKLSSRYGIVNPETKDITWGKSQNCGSGIQPSVALRTDGKIVEVHEEKHLFKKSLYYRLGQVDMGRCGVHWEHPVKMTSKAANAKIAMSDEGYVVEVHEHEGDSALCYTVGELKDTHIEWGKTHYYDVGSSPNVCIKNWSTASRSFIKTLRQIYSIAWNHQPEADDH
ncbi:hypothetical protein GBAR_LOCUS29696 [Geodia barretti]|uniref:Uncharacterized protein n=1 Tax=Geodia barretti TaxID=519541 RepID=A0AA35TVA7_GEOBA|nr:hypothetical protein GBAR_LOCUS29696 [Geodia barretti]